MHVLALTQNNISAPQYGGALRVASLLDHLCLKGIDVSVIRFLRKSDAPSRACTRLVVRDVVVPDDYGFPPLAAMIYLFAFYAGHLAKAIHRDRPVDLIQSDPPWTALVGDRVARRLRVPHVVLAQNCESSLAAQMSRVSPARRVPLVGPLVADCSVKAVHWAERRAIAGASLTLLASPRDFWEMVSLGIVPQRTGMVPNGTHVQRLPPELRKAYRARLGLQPQTPVAVFVGRLDYPPNLEAVKVIATHIAPRCPHVAFMLIGLNPPQLVWPHNVHLTGPVEEIDTYLCAADLAIVPITQASGTRIKILDAWAAGLPVLSTSAGASGLEYLRGVDIVIEDDLQRFPDRISELLSARDRLAALSRSALEAAAPYHWDTIGPRYVSTLMSLMAKD